MARLIEALEGHHEIWQRLIQQHRLGKLPHAMVFSGPPGVGKQLMAWALAQALVCERPSTDGGACGSCGPCQRVFIKQSESVLLIEPSGTQIKLEAAHQILEFLNLQRLGRARVVIVDQAQLLNAQTANALLKSIEEPPPGTYFLLITSEVAQLLPTLRSRVQNQRFSPLSDEALSRLGGGEKWMVKAARGSLTRLEEFQNEDSVGLREMAQRFLLDTCQRKRTTLEDVQTQLKDRDTSLRFARLLQQVLRDWTCEESSGGAALPEVSVLKRVEVWHAAFKVEMDILANVDRHLLWENFFYRSRAALS